MVIHTHVLAFLAKPIFCFQFVYSFQSQILLLLCNFLAMESKRQSHMQACKSRQSRLQGGQQIIV